MQLVSSPEFPHESDSNAAATEPCPKCGTALVDPNGMGWCQQCGYCKSLQEKSVQQVHRFAKPANAVQAGSAIVQLPFWFWVLILGIAVVIGATALVNTRLPLGPKFARAVWCTAQIGIGMLLILITQFVALIVLAPKDPSLQFIHAIVPGKIWGLIGNRLPAMAPCLWVGVWSLTAILSAVYFIGGLTHWNDYLPGKNKNAMTVPKVR